MDGFVDTFCPGGEDGAEEDADDVLGGLYCGVVDGGVGCALLWWLGEVGGVLDPSEGGRGGRCLCGGGRAPRRGAGPELSDGVGGSPLLQAIEQ